MTPRPSRAAIDAALSELRAQARMYRAVSLVGSRRMGWGFSPRADRS